jgi:hypothetical protein
MNPADDISEFLASPPSEDHARGGEAAELAADHNDWHSKLVAGVVQFP